MSKQINDEKTSLQLVIIVLSLLCLWENIMYKLSDEVKKNLSKTIGIPYEKLIDMDDSEITGYIEKKNGKMLGFSRPNPMFTGSGDDSVLSDRGKFSTMQDVDEKINQIIKHHKTKKQQSPAIKDEDTIVR